MEKPVIILGTGGIGRAALEIFESNKVVVYGFLEDDEDQHGTEIDSVPVLGRTDDDGYLKLIGKKCEAFVAVDNNKFRQSLVEMLHERRKMQPVNAVHQTALISKSAAIGHGNFINQGVKVGAGAEVGSHCIVHSGAVVEFNAKISDFVQIGAGSVVGSGVEVLEGAFIGSGVTIVAGVKIGKNARVGAGSVVVSDVKASDTVFGNPAQSVSK